MGLAVVKMGDRKLQGVVFIFLQFCDSHLSWSQRFMLVRINTQAHSMPDTMLGSGTTECMTSDTAFPRPSFFTLPPTWFPFFKELGV